ncbi:hypothetical protein [Anabaena catenula]|uniref:Uncharacterized protein n=1 Tax=Anabaena catenula FACHB-362 TaxID=2692877 RepID=A0ABR8JBS7_9NOST|nr:hypothetical protein [Anabaena catenula]MBD2695189.1 hypothetical protein [Anabaena catenula FACHB-362]
MNPSIYTTWLLMRLSWIECTCSEVQQRQYQSKEELVLPSEKIDISDVKIDFLKDKTKEVKDRRDGVDTKARTLLSLTSLLLGVISSATSIASANSIGILSILPLTLLFFTIFLLTVYFGIDRSQTTDYSYIFSDSESFNKMLCNDLLSAQDYNERVTNFMLDLYRSALRYFTLAMLCIMVFGIWNVISIDSSQIVNKDRIKNFIKQEIVDFQKSLNESQTADVLPKG